MQQAWSADSSRVVNGTYDAETETFETETTTLDSSYSRGAIGVKRLVTDFCAVYL